MPAARVGVAAPSQRAYIGHRLLDAARRTAVTRPFIDLTRSWWVFLLFGLVAIAFGVATLAWPGKSILALVLTFGILALADGLVSLFSVFRKDIALPNWLLLLYAAVSIAFGVLAILRPVDMGEALLWLVALWLIVAGFARVVFAILVRKVVNGEWLLALSGLLAIALGVLFLARPGVGLLTIAIWIAVGAIVYGLLQIAVALRLRRWQQPLPM